MIKWLRISKVSDVIISLYKYCILRWNSFALNTDLDPRWTNTTTNSLLSSYRKIKCSMHAFPATVVQLMYAVLPVVKRGGPYQHSRSEPGAMQGDLLELCIACPKRNTIFTYSRPVNSLYGCGTRMPVFL